MNTLDSYWKPQIKIGLVLSCKVCQYTKHCVDYGKHDGCFVYALNGNTEKTLYTYRTARTHHDMITENWIQTEIDLFGEP